MKKEVLLSYFPKITPKRHHNLMAVFGNLNNAWQCGFDDYKKIGWDDELINEFLKWRGEVDEEKIEKILKQEKIHCLTKDDAEYPPLLKEIYDPPFCLFARGELKPNEFTLAVVGPRKYTPYGKQITEELTRDLSAQGIMIVSGLALGIDSIAHQAALDANGITIAVLGTGINRAHVYPACHKQLAEKIIANGGAVISEYPPGTLPTRFTFPRRNRIIAGMSLGTLVTEATEDSGALITAQCALDYNREVFAVPQNITSLTAAGVNNLIKNGAHPVTDAQDIFNALNLQDVKKFIANREIIPDSPAEAEILKYLSREPSHVDQLVKLCCLDSSAVNSTLVLMEMKGKVRNLGGMMYVLSK